MGQHVQENVSTERPPSPTYLYNVELLHRLKGETGFTRLVVIVVDSCTGYLKSYLLEWPDNEYEPLLHRASNPDCLTVGRMLKNGQDSCSKDYAQFMLWVA